MSSLIIAEHDNSILKTATLNVITAAERIGESIHVLVAGHGCAAVADQAARINGVAKVLLVEAAHYADQSPENIAALVIANAAEYSHILAPATTAGKNLMPRIAAALDVAQISEIVAVDAPDIFVRPIYAGNILATIQSSDSIKVLTVRTTAFAQAGEGGAASISNIAAVPDQGQSKIVSQQLTQSARPDLDAAKTVISGGRGFGSGENYHALLEPLADKLNAALGASRAAVDAGYAPNDFQVGQTGKIVAPQLYIAIGISGAIQHLAGMSASRVIVAINKDADAPIFQVADYGMVGDLFDIVPALTAALD
jgi:electron transfer flavoprotein alpha subunit